MEETLVADGVEHKLFRIQIFYCLGEEKVIAFPSNWLSTSQMKQVVDKKRCYDPGSSSFESSTTGKTSMRLVMEM